MALEEKREGLIFSFIVPFSELMVECFKGLDCWQGWAQRARVQVRGSNKESDAKRNTANCLWGGRF